MIYWFVLIIFIVKIELCDILVLLLCDSLFRVFIILSWGLEVDRMVSVRGIVWWMIGLLYCNWNE